MQRPFRERVFVVLWLLSGGVTVVASVIGTLDLYSIMTRPTTWRTGDQLFEVLMLMLDTPLLLGALTSSLQYLVLGFSIRFCSAVQSTKSHHS